MTKIEWTKKLEQNDGSLISVSGLMTKLKSVEDIDKAIMHYDSGNITQTECEIRMMRALTPNTVPYFLSLATPEMIEKLKENAFCGGKIMVAWIECKEDYRLKVEQEYNRGLLILRQYFDNNKSEKME